MKQLVSNRIRVCGTAFIYPRAGIKQGGVLSGNYFSLCMDDLVEDLRKTGAGVLIKTLAKLGVLLYAIIYADDVILVARSPYGLARLITATFAFAHQYKDIVFNTGKSWILRFGTNNLSPVSVCGIPTSECQEYLGVMIGRQSDQYRHSASKLYVKTHVLLKQNSNLHRCSLAVKNLVINTYGTVYGPETFIEVNSRLRQAHRYLTRAVHVDWRQYADLPGPNIRNRRLYSVYGIDSLEVLHRKRRNNFLIKAESSKNELIRFVIGNLPRITV